MAWISAIIVSRYAPGQPADFFDGRLVTMNDSNDTTVFVNISVFEPTEVYCEESGYNFSAVFPSCDLSRCNCTDSTDCEDPFSCLPTVACLYGDKSLHTFAELCSSGFLGLIGREACDFGTLNNFQVFGLCPDISHPPVTPSLSPFTHSLGHGL